MTNVLIKGGILETGRQTYWRRKWLPTPVFLPGQFHGQRSLVGYSPWGCKESNMTEQLTHTHTHTGQRPCQHEDTEEGDGAEAKECQNRQETTIS